MPNLIRIDRVCRERGVLITFTIGEIALEPFEVAVALIGQHVGGEAVKKHAVVAAYHGPAIEFLQRSFIQQLLRCPDGDYRAGRR